MEYKHPLLFSAPNNSGTVPLPGVESSRLAATPSHSKTPPCAVIHSLEFSSSDVMTGKRLTRSKSRLNNDFLQDANSKDNQMTRQFKLGDITWIMVHDHSWWPAQVVDEQGVSMMDGKKKASDKVLVRLYGTYDYLYMDPLKCSSEFENKFMQENNSIKEAFEKALKEDIFQMISGGKSKRKAYEYNKENSSAEAFKVKKQKQVKKGRNQEADGHRPFTRAFACGSKQLKAEEENKDKARGEALVAIKTKQEQASASKVTGKAAHGTHKAQKIVNQDEVRKEVKEKANNGAKSGARKQDGSRRSKPKRSEEDPEMERRTSSNCASQEVSARRMRVMRRLGLVAPAGSPFRRNGFVIPALHNT